MSDPIDVHQPEAPRPTNRRRFVDLTPLRRSPAFARLWIGQSISGIGAQLTVTGIGLQIYDITESTLAVGLLGATTLVPMIIAGVWGGMIVDAFDRRTVAILASITGWIAIIALVIASVWDDALVTSGVRAEVWPFYVIAAVIAVSTTIGAAARSAVIPRLLPADLVSRAAALNGIGFGLQLTIGPALAGVLIATVGFPITFAVDAVLFTAGFIGVVGLPRMPPLGEVSKPGLQSLRDGYAFLRSAPNIRMSFIVDIVAMTLGRPYVLFPAIGAVVIGGGSITVGLLTASAAIGTFLASLLSGPVAHVHRHGVAISRAIMVYGGFVALFGLVVLAMQTGWFGTGGDSIDTVVWPALILACIALTGTGAADEISAIFRTTMLLTAAPDEMRGRLQGVFMVVVAGGPRVGDVYAGIAATLVALWFPPVLGGLAIIAIIAVLVRIQSTFLAYDARDPRP